MNNKEKEVDKNTYLEKAMIAGLGFVISAFTFIGALLVIGG